MLEVKNLTFLRTETLHFSFDFHVRPASILAVQGTSGVGKTTLMDLLAGFERPTSGSISWSGTAFHNEMPWHRPVTSVFQSDNLFAHLTCHQNVSIGLNDGSVDARQIDEAFVRLGIDGLQSRLPSAISGGQQQRVTLTRALLRNQPILLLDESFSALDWDTRTGCFDAVLSLCQDRGMAVLLVSHDDRDAAYLGCDVLSLD
tara:strand:+ start:429 stop:1034 length:606 start_codon:yes stop_codon:yes gene_type:complete